MATDGADDRPPPEARSVRAGWAPTRAPGAGGVPGDPGSVGPRGGDGPFGADIGGDPVAAAGLDPGGRDGPAPGSIVDAAGAYERDAAGSWRRRLDGAPVTGACDLTLGELFDPPSGEVDGDAVRLVPRAWASRHPDHPLAWTFDHADLGGRGPIPVPAAVWAARAGQVVALSAPALHPWNLVGTDVVAVMLGVAETTVRSYLARRQMPEPILRLGRTPVWSRDQIEAWQATRSRARPQSFTVRPPPGPAPRDPDDDDDGDREAAGRPDDERDPLRADEQA